MAEDSLTLSKLEARILWAALGHASAKEVQRTAGVSFDDYWAVWRKLRDFNKA